MVLSVIGKLDCLFILRQKNYMLRETYNSLATNVSDKLERLNSIDDDLGDIAIQLDQSIQTTLDNKKTEVIIEEVEKKSDDSLYPNSDVAILTNLKNKYDEPSIKEDIVKIQSKIVVSEIEKQLKKENIDLKTVIFNIRQHTSKIEAELDSLKQTVKSQSGDNSDEYKKLIAEIKLFEGWMWHKVPQYTPSTLMESIYTYVSDYRNKHMTYINALYKTAEPFYENLNGKIKDTHDVLNWVLVTFDGDKQLDFVYKRFWWYLYENFKYSEYEDGRQIGPLNPASLPGDKFYEKFLSAMNYLQNYISLLEKMCNNVQTFTLQNITDDQSFQSFQSNTKFNITNYIEYEEKINKNWNEISEYIIQITNEYGSMKTRLAHIGNRNVGNNGFIDETKMREPADTVYKQIFEIVRDQTRFYYYNDYNEEKQFQQLLDDHKSNKDKFTALMSHVNNYIAFLIDSLANLNIKFPKSSRFYDNISCSVTSSDNSVKIPSIASGRSIKTFLDAVTTKYELADTYISKLQHYANTITQIINNYLGLNFDVDTVICARNYNDILRQSFAQIAKFIGSENIIQSIKDIEDNAEKYVRKAQEEKMPFVAYLLSIINDASNIVMRVRKKMSSENYKGDITQFFIEFEFIKASTRNSNDQTLRECRIKNGELENLLRNCRDKFNRLKSELENNDQEDDIKSHTIVDNTKHILNKINNYAFHWEWTINDDRNIGIHRNFNETAESIAKMYRNIYEKAIDNYDERNYVILYYLFSQPMITSILLEYYFEDDLAKDAKLMAERIQNVEQYIERQRIHPKITDAFKENKNYVNFLKNGKHFNKKMSPDFEIHMKPDEYFQLEEKDDLFTARYIYERRFIYFTPFIFIPSYEKNEASQQPHVFMGGKTKTTSPDVMGGLFNIIDFNTLIAILIVCIIVLLYLILKEYKPIYDDETNYNNPKRNLYIEYQPGNIQAVK
jgi:hypothetical protein